MTVSEHGRAPFITVVSGLPRSGTSLMMQMLKVGGLPILTDQTRAADDNNPRGYLEFEPVKRLRSDRSFLPGAQGRAVKIIHLLLRELPTDGSFKYRVLLMKRPIREVLESQRVMLARQGKSGVSAANLEPVYRSQLEQVESWMKDHPCFTYLPVEYHRILQHPLTVAGEVQSFLGPEMSISEMARQVDPALYRQRGEGSAL